MKRVFVFFIISLMVGCALPRFKGANFSDAERPPINAEKATVYVYRVGQGNEVRPGAVKIYIDGKKIFHVRNKGFTWFLINPGQHQFKASWPWDEKPLLEDGRFDAKHLSVQLEAGKTYYINYKIVKDNKPITYAESTSILGKAMSKTHVISVGLVQEDEGDALLKLKTCGFQSNNMN